MRIRIPPDPVALAFVVSSWFRIDQRFARSAFGEHEFSAFREHLEREIDQVRRASEAEMEFLRGRQLGDTPGIGGQKREWNRRNLLN